MSSADQLIAAVCIGDLETVRSLLATGSVDINRTDSSGFTALAYAIDRGFDAVVQLLLAHHASVNSTVLFYTPATGAETGELTAMQVPPLFLALENSRLSTFCMLLSAGADPNAHIVITSSGESIPLIFIAIFERKLEFLLELIRARCNVNVTLPTGEVPLIRLLHVPHVDFHIVEAMVACGANVQAREADGQGPLCALARTPQQYVIDLLRLLIAAGYKAPDGTESRDRFSPLMILALSLEKHTHIGAYRLVPLFVKAGIEVNAHASDAYHRTTALHLAVQEHHSTSYVAALLRAGANVDAEDDLGRTPLMLAAEKGHLEIVQLLLECSAKMEVHDLDGQDAIAYAKKHNAAEVAALLENAGRMTPRSRGALFRAASAYEDTFDDMYLETPMETPTEGPSTVI